MLLVLLLLLMLLMLLLLRWRGLRGLREVGMRLCLLGRVVLRSLLLLLGLLGLGLRLGLLGLGLLLGLRLGLLGLGLNDLVGLGLVFLLQLCLLRHLLLVLRRGLGPPALLVVLLWLRLRVSILIRLSSSKNASFCATFHSTTVKNC